MDKFMKSTLNLSWNMVIQAELRTAAVEVANSVGDVLSNAERIGAKDRVKHARKFKDAVNEELDLVIKALEGETNY